MATPTSLAFVLVRFKDDPSEPLSPTAAEQMFTAAGRGTLNVVDWFDDNTHGAVDISGSRVFGWYQLPDTFAEYVARRTDGSCPRTKIVDLARAAAASAGIDLSPFVAVVAITNVGVDLFGGTGWCAPPRSAPDSSSGRSTSPRRSSARRSSTASGCSPTPGVTDPTPTTATRTTS
ncbi:MAG: hypothetical protein U0237_15585 [Thermoleophilia bacterium]